MDAEPGPVDSQLLTPEEALAILGEEVRLEVLKRLGEANGPLAYSELFDRIDYDDASNFSYHLDKLVGQFIERSEDGYAIRRSGERVMEAILSGALTTDPVRKRTQTDKPCPFCSAPIEVGYQEERVTMHCPECSGLLGRADAEAPRFTESDNLGFRPLPPAAIEGRSAGEIHDVSKIWTAVTMHTIARGVCPRCSGRVEHSITVCESHEPAEGTCEACGLRFGATASASCGNCIFEMTSAVPGHLGASSELLAFLVDHDIDPLALEDFHPYAAVDETIHSHQPFEASYTFTVDEEALTLRVGPDLETLDAGRRRLPEAE